jgi:hypothetical protein
MGKKAGTTSGAEAHAVYETAPPDRTRVTFCWTDDTGEHTMSHTTQGAKDEWPVPTGRDVQTRWIEFAPVR